MTVRGCLLAAAVFASAPAPAAAACHRYSIWAYPWPQSCRGVRETEHRPNAPSRAVAHSVTPAVGGQGFLPSSVDLRPDTFALPLLTRSDCEGGEADELTRGRLMLRAALENDHAD